MALSIKNTESDRLARESVSERVLPLREELSAIRRHCATLPVLDDGTPDEILGYDEGGLPG